MIPTSFYVVVCPSIKDMFLPGAQAKHLSPRLAMPLSMLSWFRFRLASRSRPWRPPLSVSMYKLPPFQTLDGRMPWPHCPLTVSQPALDFASSSICRRVDGSYTPVSVSIRFLKPVGLASSSALNGRADAPNPSSSRCVPTSAESTTEGQKTFELMNRRTQHGFEEGVRWDPEATGLHAPFQTERRWCWLCLGRLRWEAESWQDWRICSRPY